MHRCPEVFILVVDIGPSVNQDLCDEDIIIPSTLKTKKKKKERKKKGKYTIAINQISFLHTENFSDNYGSWEVELNWRGICSPSVLTYKERSVCKEGKLNLWTVERKSRLDIIEDKISDLKAVKTT